MNEPYRLIDLFCGAGGLTLGFTRHRNAFVPIFANEIDPAAADTYNANFGPHCVVDDIVALLADSKFVVPKADVLVATERVDIKPIIGSQT